MDTIDKNAMIYYLGEKIKSCQINITVLENKNIDGNYPIEEEMLLTEATINIYKAMLEDINIEFINQAYDKHCIKNGLNRGGFRILV